MNVIQDSFKQLVDRKLWPIAALLVVALAAIPFLLSKDAEEAPLPATTAAVPANAAAEDAAVVTLEDPSKGDSVRTVLGNRKDPFRPAQLNRVPKEEDTLTDGGVKTQVGTDPGTSSGGGGGGTESTGGTTTTTPAPTATPAPKPTYDLYSLKVRFGPTDGPLVTREVKRLTGLPGGTQPAALYLGLLGDRKTAVFIIDAGVEVLGDGRCEPSPEDCQTLMLKKGETEFLTRGDKQWQLDLVDINVKKTTDARAAKKSRTAVAADGRRKLKRLRGRSRAFAYDEAKGSLKRVTRSARSARVTRQDPGVATFGTSG